ncbi:PDDEXK family nuclease [Paraburkholderia sediminicola]|uniref:hypothetical protein n=1 Tax=Paraburkholderia sediminicola TaxID=458836 RepID=UPI0038BCEBC5
MAVMTWEKLEERIASGRGSGHRDEYRPWLWIHRRNASAKGNQVVDRMPGYRRSSHFLARVESHVAILCLFLGASDVREQFPLWPMPHPHPLSDLRGGCRGQLSSMRGLLSIAMDAGIEHGVEVGSGGVPYVATLDLAITLVEEGKARLAGISLKPHDEITKAEPTDRISERLGLESLYLSEANAYHRIVDCSLLGNYTGGNLETFSSAWYLPPHLRSPALIEDFCGRFIEVALVSTISSGISHAASRMGPLSLDDANLLWRHGVWTRRIGIDITKPLELGRELRLDGQSIADRLACELFGEAL